MYFIQKEVILKQHLWMWVQMCSHYLHC